MSRAAGGTYTLPAGNPVVTGTTISSTWGNTTLADIATALTDSLSRSGLGGMTAPLLGADGTQALPAYSFTNEPSSGFFRSGAGTVALSLLNTTKAAFSATSLTLNNTAASNVTGLILQGTSTGYNAINIGNTSGSTVLGVETSAGNILMSGSTAYSTIIQSGVATSLFLGTNQTARIGITNTGVVTINSPSAGVPLTVNNSTAATVCQLITSTQSQTGASPTLQLQSTAASGFSTLSLCSNTGTAGTNDLALFQNGSTSDATIVNRANAILNLGSNNTTRVVIGAAGTVVVNAPTAGVALTVNGVTGSTACSVVGVTGSAGLVITGSASTPVNAIGNSSTAFTIDFSKSNVHTVTMTGNVPGGSLTLSNAQDGQTINVFLTQDGTGTRTLGYPAAVKWAGGAAGVLSTPINSVDILTLTFRSATGFYYASLAKAFA